MFFINNPWLVAVVGGAIGAILAGIVLFYWFEHRAQKKDKIALKARTNNADELLKKNRTDDALAIYQDMLKTVSVRKYPEIYAHIKHSEGMCYSALASVSDKEENLTRAIGAFEEALRIYTVERYPLYYEIVMSNMRIAKQKLQSSP